MTYQISRNGLEYGPYTLEDLQRYLASGNVLPTDLAKGEGMTAWVPVLQVVGGAGTSEAAAGPFAEAAAGPGSSRVGTVTGATAAGAYAGFDHGVRPAEPGAALAASPYADAVNLHWGLYLLFAVLTCGLFSKVFTVVQAIWMKKVQPNSIALWFYIGAYVLAFINAYRSRVILTSILSHHYDPLQRGGGGGFTLLYVALIIASRFLMKSSLEEHFNGPEPIGLRLSGVMTFFFGGVNFQYHLNRINEMKRAARYGAGAMRPY